MEVRHLLEDRDNLARMLAADLAPRKIPRKGGGFDLEEKTLDIGMTVQGHTSPESGKSLAACILHWVALHLVGADVILWKPSLFDAAMYPRGEKGGQTIDRAILPRQMQYWIPDADEGRSRVWQTIERQYQEDNGNAVRLLCIITGMLPYDAFAKFDDRVTAADMNALCMGRGIEQSADNEHSPLCPVVWVFREKGGDKRLFYHVSILIGGRLLAFSEHCMVPFAGLEFMAQQFICRDRVGEDRRGRKFRFPDRYRHRSTVERLVLRERFILPIGYTEPQEGDKAGREWQHHWHVRSHPRTLAKPRKSDGATVIEVASSIKGDRTKPLLPPRDRVIQVVR